MKLLSFYNKNYRFKRVFVFIFKNFNFNKLGSTSSIGTAINSAIVKNAILYPSENILYRFLEIVNPIFENIRLLETQTKPSQLRDTCCQN